MHQIVRLLLILCICLYGTDTVSKSSETLAQTILTDIRNAFKVVTNDTHRLNRIIPEMYASILKQPNPHFVFKLLHTTRDNNQPTTAMLSMQRNDFANPTFPNLTTQYMSGMHKWRQHTYYAEIASPSVIFKDRGSGGDTAGTRDWSKLGLHGWTGEISQPIMELELSHKNAEKFGLPDPRYQSVNILLDFTKGEIDAFINDIDTMENGEIKRDKDDRQTSTELKMDNDANVYIARVNYPFGYSTKWSLRNSTPITQLLYTPLNNGTTMDERSKRDVVNLYSMIKCSTGCEPLAYKGYGCYCGFSGAGVPVDGIDRCCKLHDKCYEYSNCIAYMEYFVPYVWKCYHGKPLCAINHGEWGGPQSCAARLCHCDLRLSRCLRQYTCPKRLAVCTSSLARRLQHLLLYK